MTRRMLINARTPEELRIAIVDGKSLENYQVEVAERGLARGNIYRGTIAGIQPSLNAAFIEYGAERHGFLAIQDVVPDAYYHKPKGGRPRIEEVLDKGRPIIVQVTKEAEGRKGAALTTNLSLAGRYLVLTPFSDTLGISRKVDDDETRKKLKQHAQKLERPAGCGVIIRTNALDQNKTALNRDLNALLRLWKRVSTEARKGSGPKLIYSDQDLILRTLRDHLDTSIEEVLTDDDRAFAKAQEYMRAFMPRSKTRLVRYQEREPLFSRFDVESQIERIYDREVNLPGGGSIVIDRTEALVAIDVNSGRATRAGSQEETAVNTNLEAAQEVARQLRLRDIGGLVVVDFIDMWSRKYQRKVEKTLRDAMKIDKARFTVGRISSNGLLEINRQRIQQALLLRTHRACPTCAGTGRIASPEMVGLNLLRRIESRATTKPTERVRIALHPEIADAFQNGRRREIAALESEFDLKIEIISSSRLHRPDLELEWFDRKPAEAGADQRPEARVEAESVVATTNGKLDGKRRKRPSRSRKKKAEKAEPAKKPAAKKAEKAPAKSSSRRRRGRRRGGAKKTAAAGEGGAQAEKKPADKPDRAATAASPADQPSSGDGAGPKPKTRRRRSRRRRSRKATASAASGGSPEGAATPPAGEPAASDG